MRNRPDRSSRSQRPLQRRPRRAPRRSGFTLLELEVAMVIFMLAMTGICPLVVMYSKQLRSLQARFNPQTTYYLVPSADLWARKLGAAASVMTQSPGASSPPAPSAPKNNVQIQSLNKTLTGEVVTAYVTAVAS